MKITFSKGQREDWIGIERDDGSRADTRFPHKGPVPHDAVHLFVESGFGLSRGFWGMIAEGHHPEELVEIAKLGGHASAKRAEVPSDDIVQLLQAERLVEVFEADLWSGGSGDAAGVLDLGRTACDYSHVAMPGADTTVVDKVRGAIRAFAAQWQGVPVGQKMCLAWPMMELANGSD
ncbi:MAG: hypothetical protein ACKOOL_07655 [Novosphingobium sp.]